MRVTCAFLLMYCVRVCVCITLNNNRKIAKNRPTEAFIYYNLHGYIEESKDVHNKNNNSNPNGGYEQTNNRNQRIEMQQMWLPKIRNSKW